MALQQDKSSPRSELAAAVEGNDVARLSELLSRHPELRGGLNEPLLNSGFGTTPLLRAVEHRNTEMIDVLLGAGADINARSRWWAGSFGVLDHEHGLTEFLIARGATVDIHAAARMGRMDQLQELVSTRPGLVHALGGDGQTPLHFATTVPIAEFLLDHGARIDARDVDHESTPAQYMVRDRPEVARYLVSRGCSTDLLLLAALGNLEGVRRWVDAEPGLLRMRVSDRYFPRKNPHSGGCIYIWTLGQNKSAHAVAREFGHEQVFQLLMDRSPAALQLARAGEVGDEAIVKRLLATHPGLAKELTEEDGAALVYAAQKADFRAVQVMLEAGWPVNVRGQHGGTALHWAAWHGNADLVELLLAFKASTTLKDVQFEGTPLGWARHGVENSWLRQTGDYPRVLRALEAVETEMS